MESVVQVTNYHQVQELSVIPHQINLVVPKMVIVEKIALVPFVSTLEKVHMNS